jgi:predicted SnoaL-like aldol condensation-catalyzing enzyme
MTRFTNSRMAIASLAVLAFLWPGGRLAWAQQIPPQANPAPGCTSTPAQMEATKKAALDFAFLTGEAKIALADPTYIQHNPVQHKRAQVEGTSDFESFKKTFLAQAAAPAGGAGAGGGRGAAVGPQPPAGNRAEIVLVQCDIVAVIHKVNLQDPTAAPGTFYEAFTFDAYRVKNGKVTEHWDANTIPAPAQGGRGQ